MNSAQRAGHITLGIGIGILIGFAIGALRSEQEPIDPGVPTQWMFTDADWYDVRVYKGNPTERQRLLQAANCYKIEGQWECFELAIHNASDDNDGLTHDTAWETIGGPHPSAEDGPAPRYIGTDGNNVNDGLSSYPFKEMTPDERLRSTCYPIVPRHETFSVVLNQGVTCISVIGVTAGEQ